MTSTPRHGVAAGVLLALALALPAAGGGLGAPADAPPAGPLAGRTIAVDPGHNGGNATHPRQIGRLVPAGGFRKPCDTTGTATADGRLTESAFTWAMARRLRAVLAAQGARVVLTRRDDRGVGPCVNERAAIGNRARADLAISLHADGGPPTGRGFHVIAPAAIPGRSARIVAPSLAFARRVRARLRAAGLRPATYLAGGGLVQRSDLAGLNLSTVPKVFVELGNMRNAADAAQLRSPAWRQRVAAALVAAIATTVRRG